jgi:glycosyltransferase involved in cell wall biosynthesis
MTTRSDLAVSIIIPCRNEVGHIEACLDSVLCQEEPDGGCEILVADGMSNDGTRAVLDRYAARHRAVRID